MTYLSIDTYVGQQVATVSIVFGDNPDIVVDELQASE